MEKGFDFWILVVWFILLFVIRLKMMDGKFFFLVQQFQYKELVAFLGLELTLFLLPL